jgi:hypothetical protein
MSFLYIFRLMNHVSKAEPVKTVVVAPGLRSYEVILGIVILIVAISYSLINIYLYSKLSPKQ